MYKYKNQLLPVLACPLPRRFTLMDSNGKYWCLSDDGHLHTEDHCPNNFKSESRHIFHAMSGEDDDDIPYGKCAIQSFRFF